MSTITKEFTKEQLIEQAKKNIEVLRGAVEKIPGASDAAVIHLKLAEITLASLEAEPVAWLLSGGGAKNHVSFDSGNAYADPLREVTPLYTTPPAPVSVPDEDLLHMAASAIDDLLSNKDRSGAGVWADIPAKLRRAAMLQGSDDNSPVIPDGWVACSERMPEEGSKVIVFRPRASESNDPPVKTATYKGGREYYHGFDCYCEPTHWMPLPAAPQQEVK